MLICFDFDFKMVEYICMSAPKLPQYISTGEVSFWISSFRYHSHIASPVTSYAALYSTSCIDSEIIISLFDCNRIGLKLFSSMLT
jgi:hypothetical protein